MEEGVSRDHRHARDLLAIFILVQVGLEKLNKRVQGHTASLVSFRARNQTQVCLLQRHDRAFL